jgi:hypothetical protein
MTRRTPHDIVAHVATQYVAAVKAGDSRTVTAYADAHGVSQAALYRALARLDAPRRRRGVAGAPPLDELEDACARWGFDGAAEEYDVSEETVREWLRAYGELSEGRKP